MASILENPVVHYGVPIFNAAIIAAIAFALLDGTARLVALGIVVLEVAVAPQILKRAG